MTDCIALSDRMPEVARGRRRWEPAEAAHLAACADCAAEWRLVQATTSLGEDMLAGFDVERAARRLEASLGGAPAARPLRPRRWIVWAIAAAASVALVVGVLRQPTPAGPRVAAVSDRAASAPVLPELDRYGTPELEAVLEQLDGVPTAAAPVEVGGLGDLSETELETVLSTMEG